MTRTSDSKSDEDPGSDKRTKKDPSFDKTDRPQQVTNFINAQSISIDSPNLGFGERGATRAATPTGPRSEDDVLADLERYLAPSCFGLARTRLDQTNMVVLTGPVGSGKRTGATALLHAVAPGGQTWIRPSTRFEELHQWDFKSKKAYLLADHLMDTQGPQAEFDWRILRDRVAQAGAFLVITTIRHVSQMPCVAWQRPALIPLLEALLAGLPAPAELARRLAPDIPEDWSLALVSECANQVRADPDHPAEALEVFDLGTIAEIERWFDEPGRDWLDTIEVTALVFGWGSGERQFESFVEKLEATLDVYLPADEPNAGERTEAPSQRRSRRRKRRCSGLVQTTELVQDGFRTRILTFKSERHRRHVLKELWASYPTPFWNGVRDWLNNVISDDQSSSEDLLRIASGVTLLMEVNTDEAITSYLEPWGRDESNVTAMQCAALVLRMMALDESLALLARQIAVTWVSEGDVSQRLCAAEALMAELGGLYQAEAARRLWQLISQDASLGETALSWPAELFVYLVKNEEDPTELLMLLREKMDRHNHDTIDLTLATIAKVLSIRVQGSNRLASFDLMVARPALAPMLASLWAGLLANGRYRAEALVEIWTGVRNSADRARAGDLLGGALAEVIPPALHSRFAQHLRNVDRRQRQLNKEKVDSIAHLIIDALEHLNDPAT